MFEGVEVDRCTGCSGLWFDDREKDQLLEVTGSEVIDTGDRSTGREFNKKDRIPCPRCKGQMIRMVDKKKPDIWYEQCSICGGMWFDAGEFRDLKRGSFLDVFRGMFAPSRE